MRKRIILMFSLVSIAAVMLTACRGVISETGKPAEGQDIVGSGNTTGNSVDTQPDQPAAPVSAPSEGETQPDQGEDITVEEPVGNLPAKPELGFGLGRAELVATDPSQVNLASGRLQLVEMFAFW